MIKAGASRSDGATGVGSALGTIPRSLSVITSVRPSRGTIADATMIAMTMPSGPMRVRSNATIIAIVSNPMATLAQWSWAGCSSVSIARTSRLGPWPL